MYEQVESTNAVPLNIALPVMKCLTKTVYVYVHAVTLTRETNNYQTRTSFYILMLQCEDGFFSYQANVSTILIFSDLFNRFVTFFLTQHSFVVLLTFTCEGSTTIINTLCKVSTRISFTHTNCFERKKMSEKRS